jgi:hypothetical protein
LATPLSDAVRVAWTAVVIVPALAVNVAVVAPAGTVTDAATGSKLVELDNATVVFAVGAALSTTLQVVDCADSRVAGVQVKELSAGAGR